MTVINNYGLDKKHIKEITARDVLGGGRKHPKKEIIPMQHISTHIRYKLDTCKHQMIPNLLYGSGQSCIHCGVSLGTIETYKQYMHKG